MKEWLWKTVIFVIFQLPLTVFYANFGLALDESITIIEKFYIVDSGFCAITGSAILGLVLSALYFLLAMLLVAYIGYRIVLKQR